MWKLIVHNLDSFGFVGINPLQNYHVPNSAVQVHWCYVLDAKTLVPLQYFPHYSSLCFFEIVVNLLNAIFFLKHVQKPL